MDLEKLKKTLQTSVKGSHVEILSDSTIASEREWFPTPALDLNRILSGSFHKGLPSKSLTLLVAPEASFKSSFMCLCAAQAQKQGYTPVIFDTEGGWTSDFVKRWGMDSDNILYIYTPWINEVMTMMGQIIDDVAYQKMFIILDSMGGLEMLKMVDDATSKDKTVKQDQGMLQKQMKRMLKMFLNIVKMRDSVGVMAGHFFGNPNSYGNADEIGGGKFAKLAPDIIVSMKKQLIYSNPEAKAADRIAIGSEINALTLKNRFYPPFQQATVQIDYKSGVNSYAGLIEMALDCGIIQVGGSWFTFPDGRKAQGKVKAMEMFKESPDEIINQLEDILKTTGYSTVNEEVKAAEELSQKIDDENITEEIEENVPKKGKK